MDSSNSLNVTVWGLKNSPYPEDNELANRCGQIIKDLLDKLKPILRYLCAPQSFHRPGIPDFSRRCLPVGTYFLDRPVESRPKIDVYLDADAKFFEAENGQIRISQPSFGFDTWGRLPFSDLVEKLREALVEAEAKRNRHLEAVAERREMLDNLVLVLHPKARTELTPEEIMERFGRLCLLHTSVKCRSEFPPGPSKWYLSLGGVEVPVHTMDMSGSTPAEAVVNAWRAITDPKNPQILIRYFCKRYDDPVPPENAPQVWVRWNHQLDDWEDANPPEDEEWGRRFASHASKILPYSEHKVREARN